MEGQPGAPDGHWHVGLVVDERSRVRALAEAAGATLLEGPYLDFLDPWRNRVEVAGYQGIQFTKKPNVLHGMGPGQLASGDRANKKLADKGLGRKSSPTAAVVHGGSAVKRQPVTAVDTRSPRCGDRGTPGSRAGMV
jgi:hypothetical protein